MLHNLHAKISRANKNVNKTDASFRWWCGQLVGWQPCSTHTVLYVEVHHAKCHLMKSCSGAGSCISDTANFRRNSDRQLQHFRQGRLSVLQISILPLKFLQMEGVQLEILHFWTKIFRLEHCPTIFRPPKIYRCPPPCHCATEKFSMA